MFTFLDRLGRTFVVTLVLVAALAVVGVTAIGQNLTANHRNAPTAMACATTGAGVGQVVTVSGHGFAASTQYVLFVSNPAGHGATTVYTDGSGAFAYSSTASWNGTYAATVWSSGKSSRQLATCTSLTL